RQWKIGRMDGSFAERVCLWTGGTLVAVLVLGVALSTSVGAQNTDDLRVVLDRMERLERDIRTINLSLSRGRPVTPPVSGAKPVLAVPKADPRGAPDDLEGNPGLARMEVRLSALENDLRSATGSMEQFGFQIREIGKRLDKLVSDMDYRLSVLEGRTQGQPGAVSGARTAAPPRLSAAPAPPPVQKIIPGQAGGFAIPPTTLGTISQNSQSVVTPPAAQKRPGQKPAPAARAAPAQPAPAPTASAATIVLPPGTAKEQYNYAFGLLRQANYDKAELALQEFVKLHPKEALASNARYWLGETFYVRAAYVQAAEVFLEGFQADPKGPKASDSLLKLGMSLGGLDKKREACAAFDKLLKDFPDAPAGVKNTVTREKQKNGCS
ncbi:MAG: tol-pal system protein YbgF, partial [Rhodospirillales bacterium]|nr:tol-pal system protein YbgF [Rhodospirillales bacterium]